MNNFDWDEFKKGNVAVWCKTEEVAKDFLSECDKKGIEWSDGNSTTRFTHYSVYGGKICYTHHRSFGLCHGSKEYFQNKHTNIIEWESQTGFTLQELVTRNVPGVYVNTCKHARVKKIEISKYGVINFITSPNSKNEFGIDPRFKFKLQEPKKQCVLYGIEHKEDGKIYYFRNKGNFRNKGAKVIPDGSFVVCDTSQGKSYGKAVQRIEKELTEKEYLEYKECWRA